MKRYRLAQSNTWVYSIQEVLESCSERERTAMRHQVECELQAWVMKMDPDREVVPHVTVNDWFDGRDRIWKISAQWVSPRQIHTGEQT